ncbi:MAG: carbohydrate ABC transporter permease [Caldicoprobacterales bacterium]|jgi:putative aldouronate transport system permease protein|nr:carbohydrate ABC transporter permease [Clostridiales bacterium]
MRASKEKAVAWNYGKKGVASRIFDTFNVLLMCFLIVVTLYPFIYVLFASFSEPLRLMAHRGILLAPLGFSTGGYSMVFNNDGIVNGYMVTIYIAIVGTLCNMIASLLFAYVLSRRNMMWHGLITVLAVFTMYFGGGLIPTYLVVNALGLIDSLWALILPGLINTYNVIILRTAFNSVPVELEESARLDGAGEFWVLVNIMIPLIKPTIAAISLFYMVGHWNSWTSALIYIKTPTKYPLQLVLRSILIQNDTQASVAGTAMYQAGEDYAARMLLKYSTIIVSIVPIICVYPFLQKYFTKGIMIGALKG